jgi:2-dehydro-3-deoxygluconokinase
MPRYAALGEIMIELSQQPSAEHQDFRLGFAGDTYNSCVYMARLGLTMSYITRLGDDGFSRQMLQQMQEEGIDTQGIASHPGRSPGLYMIQNRPDGEREFAYWRSASPARELFAQADDEARLQGFDGIYLSGISLAILSRAARLRLFEALSRLRKQGVCIAFDSNYRPRLWENPVEAQGVISQMLSLSDIALLSLEDEGLLWGDASLEACCQRHAGKGVAELVIKQGPEAVWVIQGQRRHRIEVPPVPQVRDTTGAGDSFNGAYLAARWQGSEVVPAAIQGNACAGLVIQHRGAILPCDSFRQGWAQLLHLGA